jgi:hypothetical protein
VVAVELVILVEVRAMVVAQHLLAQVEMEQLTQVVAVVQVHATAVTVALE